MSTQTSNSPARGDARRLKRRNEIVEAASTLFGEAGYADCDMECVAVRLGIAKGTLYLYFKSKEELFLACVDWGMQLMQQEMHAAEVSTDDPFERIARAIKAYLTFFAERPQFVELLIQERAIFKNRKRPTYFEYRDAARVRWRTFYQDLIDQGRLRPGIQIEGLLNTVGNLVYGTMFTNYFLGNRSIEEQQRSILDIIFHGILSDAERHPAVPPATDTAASG